jgi:hypothetical protein
MRIAAPPRVIPSAPGSPAPALAGIAGALGVPLPARPPERCGSSPGQSRAATLIPGCWPGHAGRWPADRGIPRRPRDRGNGPLGQFRGGSVSGDDLLGLAPPAGLTQLAEFRHIFETALLPQFAARMGPLALGPTFAGSELIKADVDLIAAGLLLGLKTSAKLSLSITDLLQVIGDALLDFDDDYRVMELGIFTARYGYLASWELGAVLSELAGHEISVQSARDEFRGFPLACADAR